LQVLLLQVLLFRLHGLKAMAAGQGPKTNGRALPIGLHWPDSTRRNWPSGRSTRRSSCTKTSCQPQPVTTSYGRSFDLGRPGLSV